MIKVKRKINFYILKRVIKTFLNKDRLSKVLKPKILSLLFVSRINCNNRTIKIENNLKKLAKSLLKT